MSNQIIVVGDRFSSFAENNGVLTASALERWLDQPSENMVNPPTGIRLGQGIPVPRLNALVERLRARGIHVPERDVQRRLYRATKDYSHKHRPENTLISKPYKVNTGVYALDLLIDEYQELLLDHLTGQHVQGMVITEAARQTFIAVTTYDLLDEVEDPYFVLKQMDVEFHRFMFPLEAEIEFRLEKHSAKKPGRSSYKATIDFRQLDECLAEASVAYTVIERSELGRREADMAQQAVEQSLQPVPEARAAQL